MTESNDIDKKLENLKNAYKIKLPEKFNAIETDWKILSTTSTLENLSALHLKIHSLHGTANTYGYLVIGEIAAKLEVILKEMLSDPKLIQKYTSEINNLISDLHAAMVTPLSTDKVIAKNIKLSTSEKIIYILDDDYIWAQELMTKANHLTYQFKRFDKIENFIEAIQNNRPSFLITNIDLVDNKLKEMLQENELSIPMIVIASSGEFYLRLKAVRVGSQAYYIKPFLIEDLIKKMEYLLKEDTTPYRVLIVDDESDVAHYNAAILEQANIETRCIYQSHQIDRVVHEFNPDLILTDITMPDCTGVELAAIIRQQNVYQSMPIMYLSAEEDYSIRLKAMKLGADDFLTKSSQSDYLIMIIKNRIARYRELRSLMVKDSLTGLYNSAFILNQLDIELKESMQLHNPLSIAIIEIDRFQSINDSYGHQAGDQVIKSLGLMIMKRLSANQIVGRYDSNRLLVILPNTSLQLAATLIEELRKQFLTVNYSWNQQIFNASFLAGLAFFPDLHTPTELLEAANDTINQAKRLKTNR